MLSFAVNKCVVYNKTFVCHKVSKERYYDLYITIQNIIFSKLGSDKSRNDWLKVKVERPRLMNTRAVWRHAWGIQCLASKCTWRHKMHVCWRGLHTLEFGTPRFRISILGAPPTASNLTLVMKFYAEPKTRIIYYGYSYHSIVKYSLTESREEVLSLRATNVYPVFKFGLLKLPNCIWIIIRYFQVIDYLATWNENYRHI